MENNLFIGILKFWNKVFNSSEDDIINPNELGTSNRELDTLIKEYYMN